MPFQRQIETDFNDSWSEVEAYFKDISSVESYAFTKPLLQIIAHLREKNYDKVFRVGQSMWIMVLSRSEHWGLRDDQHSIGIEPTQKNTFNVFYSDGDKQLYSFETSDLEGNTQFEAMLNELIKQPIN